MSTTSHRGFTLLIAVILSSVALSIGLALLDIAYKQYVLASAARQSQYAFYRADTAMECALFHDQGPDAFAFASLPSPTISCGGQTITLSSSVVNSIRTTTFTLPCTGGTGTAGQVTVRKASDATTNIYATGYNTCDANNTRRVERGLKVTY